MNDKYSKNGPFVHPKLAPAGTCMSIYQAPIPTCTGDRVYLHKTNLVDCIFTCDKSYAWRLILEKGMSRGGSNVTHAKMRAWLGTTWKHFEGHVLVVFNFYGPM